MDSTYLCRGMYAGKCRDFIGQFVKGDLVMIGDKPYIHPRGNTTEVSDTDIAKLLIVHPVDPITVGHCTGLTAAKSYRGERPEDELVFEGDKLKDDENFVWEVRYSMGNARFEMLCDDLMAVRSFGDTDLLYFEIIGTIHDKEAQPCGN